MLRAVIFDCDGVIVDSELIYLESLKYFLYKLGAKTKLENIKFLVGKDINEITLELQKQFNLYDYSIGELIIGQREEFFRMFYSKPIYPMEGLIEFLKDLKKNNIRMAVASSSSRKYIHNLLNNFKIECYFDYIITGEDVVHSKPDPEIYLKAAKGLGIENTEAIIIEDSVNGIKAGKAANIKVIGLKESKLHQNIEEADFNINHFSELTAHRCIEMIDIN